jgi:hypothetical protein
MRNNISNIVGSYQFAFKGNEYCMMGGNLASRCLPRTIPDQITVKRRLRLKGLVASASGLLNPDRIQIEQLYIKHRVGSYQLLSKATNTAYDGRKCRLPLLTRNNSGSNNGKAPPTSEGVWSHQPRHQRPGCLIQIKSESNNGKAPD